MFVHGQDYSLGDFEFIIILSHLSHILALLLQTPCLTLEDKFKPTGISGASPTFLGRRGTFMGFQLM